MSMYTVKEIFYSLQGEGVRAGTPNVFVRFAGCNLHCSVDKEGFDCDTDFSKGEKMSALQIRALVEHLGKGCKSVIFTGGEPALQLDQELVDRFPRGDGWYLAIETNGTKVLGVNLDWITVSPKNTDLHLYWANELKYVVAEGMLPPRMEDPPIVAEHYLLSPAFHPGKGEVNRANLDWCIKLCLANPRWRLSVQQHKAWGIR